MFKNFKKLFLISSLISSLAFSTGALAVDQADDRAQVGGALLTDVEEVLDGALKDFNSKIGELKGLYDPDSTPENQKFVLGLSTQSEQRFRIIGHIDTGSKTGILSKSILPIEKGSVVFLRFRANSDVPVFLQNKVIAFVYNTDHLPRTPDEYNPTETACYTNIQGFRETAERTGNTVENKKEVDFVKMIQGSKLAFLSNKCKFVDISMPQIDTDQNAFFSKVDEGIAVRQINVTTVPDNMKELLQGNTSPITFTFTIKNPA